jgi:hypothetical protein
MFIQTARQVSSSCIVFECMHARVRTRDARAENRLTDLQGTSMLIFGLTFIAACRCVDKGTKADLPGVVVVGGTRFMTTYQKMTKQGTMVSSRTTEVCPCLD